MSTTAPSQRWVTATVTRLRRNDLCPVCDSPLPREPRCPVCGSDLSGAAAAQARAASAAAADALVSRQRAVADMASRTPSRAPAAVAAPPPGPVRVDLPPPGASATVQSVLAVAGACLVAVAAVIFAFASPDVRDPSVRSGILTGATLLLLAGAILLVRRRLRFSAEAVAAVSVVFLLLDVAAVLAEVRTDPAPFVAGAMALFGAALVALGARTRIRVWFTVGICALAGAPAAAGVAVSGAFAGAAGLLCAAGAAAALIAVSPRWSRRLGGAPGLEPGLLTAAQTVFLIGAAVDLGAAALRGTAGSWAAVSVGAAATALVAACTARHLAATWWSIVTGGALAAAFVTAPLTIAPSLGFGGVVAATSLAAAAGLLAVAAIRRGRHAVRPRPLTAGALIVVGLVATAPALLGVSMIVVALGGSRSGLVGSDEAGILIALGALAVGSFGFDLVRPAGAGGRMRWGAGAGGALAILMVLASTASAGLVSLPWREAGALVVAAALALTAHRLPRAPRRFAVTGAHALVAVSAVLVWHDPDWTLLGGLLVLLAAGPLVRAVPSRTRFLHTGIGYAYALALWAFALASWSVEPAPLLSAVTSAGGLVAIGATALRRLPAPSWAAVLVVTGIPFGLGVATVVAERTVWTGASTTVILVLALTLTLTTRTGTWRALRLVAAALVVPAFAVVLVCFGAVLLPQSGSPVVLPVVAATAALVLAPIDLLRALLQTRIGGVHAAVATLGLECSTLLTGAIAVALSLVREAAGPTTAIAVLLLLAVAGFGAARWSRRSYGWWLGAASLTGSMWCVWSLQGLGAPEPYLLPPGIAAVAVGTALAARGRRGGRGLVIGGLVVAVVPMLVTLAAWGGAERTIALLGGAAVLVASGWLLRGRLAPLRLPALLAGIAAAAAGPVQAARWGLGYDQGVPATVAALLAALTATAIAALAGFVLRRGLRVEGRWPWLAALLYPGLALWPTVHRDWSSIWTLWLLMLAYLLLLLLVTARTLRGPTSAPPAWSVFAMAFVTGVVAWSPRELRVEWFSLPLGAFLTLAGALAMTAASASAGRPRRMGDWPVGWSSSWHALGPGIAVLLSASVTATYTDPQTWRAVLVIILALGAILVGARLRLAAPFLIGIAVLPVENVLAFVVQIGRGIAAMPWWITLAVVGAVLLIIAVTYERRADGDGGIAARLRDLA